MSTVKQHLRISALLEGVSFIVLLVIAMPLKYYADMPQMVTYVGGAHGFLFIWYVIAVMVGREAYKFTLWQTAIALLGSLVPLGTFYADNKIFKKIEPKREAN